MIETSLPIIDATAIDPPDRRPSVAGVLLAAGTSSRFGAENKLLASLDGTPIVRHAASTLAGSALDPVVAVVGHDGDAVQRALEGLDVEPVENPAYRSGQASSLRTGIDRIAERDVDAVVVALGDMPTVSEETIETLVAAYANGVGDPLAAAVDGTRGNPVLFGRRHFETLADVEGDTGGRKILLTDPESALIEVDDPGVRYDVDTPADL
ncbi:MAG: nucleotidyltransferase family protein [Natronomonas sp.]